MYTKLGDEKLRSGEFLETGVITAPDVAFAPAIQKLLCHKGPEWEHHIRATLKGDTDQLETRFYFGSVEGAHVANVMTVEGHGVGILGHVFTTPEHRRKGICRAIMQSLMEHFQERDGRVLLLSTGFESPPYWIYHSFGFRSIREGFMRFDAAPKDAFEPQWFSSRKVHVTPLAWRHWPLLAFLGTQAGGEPLRSAAWKLFGMGNLEGPVVRTLSAQVDDKGTTGVVLETEMGAVVGCATLHPTGAGMNGWPGVWLLDLFTHPHFTANYREMLWGLEWPRGKIIAYVDTESVAKAESLKSNGFVCEGNLQGFLRTGEEPLDVWIYGRTY